MKGRFLRTLLVTTVLAVFAHPQVSSAGTDAPPPTTLVTNEFIPQDADLDDCVSALPRPECGSEARGGWRQGAIFGVLVVGMAIITWRIVVGLRRPTPSGSPTGPPPRTPT